MRDNVQVTVQSRVLSTIVRHLSLISDSFTHVFVEDANHMIEGIKYLLGDAKRPCYLVARSRCTKFNVSRYLMPDAICAAM